MEATVFIDGGNIFHSVKQYNQMNGTSYRVDFGKLPAYLTKTLSLKEVLRTYYYTGVPVNISKSQMGFLTSLDLTPNFEVKKKTLKIKNGRFQEKGVDVQIAIDMLWCGFNKHCRHIVLLSGDEDLSGAVDRLKECGIRVTVAAFRDNASSKIIRSADNFINLAEDIAEFASQKSS